MSSSAKRIRLESSRQLRSQVTTIEKLCDDVLVEIFSYLSAEELKSVSLVCKHWNEGIGSSTKTMKKFKLKLMESELISRQFRSIRNHQNIELEMLTVSWRELLGDQKALKNLGRFIKPSQVKYFKIFAHNPEADPKIENKYVGGYDQNWETFSIDAMKLTSALKQMKQLQELFIDCQAGFRGSFTTTMDLPKLTKLAVKSFDMKIFQWISADNVNEIDVSHQSYGQAFGNPIVIVHYLDSFLKLCKQITTLKLNSSQLHDLFGNGKWKDFKLKLSDLHIDINHDATSIKEFLISQAASLISLSITDVFCLSGSMRTSLIEALSQLKSLKILSLSSDHLYDVAFLRHLTELEQLTVYAANDINSIARFNRKLTYLKIEFVANSLDAALEFSELKHLCIGIDISLNCLKVIKSSPKSETIELTLSQNEVDAHSCEEAIKAAMQQPNLRHLKFEFWEYNLKVEHVEGLFDSITSDYGHLKSLTLSMKVGSGIRSVEFLLPVNRSDWKADEEKLRLMETFTKN